MGRCSQQLILNAVQAMGESGLAVRELQIGTEEQATVNVTSFEDSPEQINEPLVPDATTYTFEE